MRQVSQSIPKEIQQVASTHRLGAPQSAYMSSKVSLLYRLLGPICIVIGGLIIVAYLLTYDSVFSQWPQWQAVLIPIIGVTWVCVGGWITLSPFLYPGLRVFVCPKGLIYAGRKTEAIPWEQIEGFWKDSHIDANTRLVLSRTYIVLRADRETFVFKNDILGVERLGERIEQEVTRRLLPKAIAAYDAAMPVDFDEIMISPRGVRVKQGRKALAWSEIENISVDAVAVSIYKKGTSWDWATIRIIDVPNAAVFEGLIEHIKQEQGQDQLPHLIALYEMGQTVVFDRLSISKQGIDVNDGRQRLPWSEIESIGVGRSEVIIRRRGDGQEWFALPLWLVPDAALLKSLIDYILNKNN